MKNSQTIYLSKMPLLKAFPPETVLFYDSILAKKPFFKKWSSLFQYKIPLASGESLKSLTSFEQILKSISGLNVPHTTSLTFVAVGGGSVGDFVGFLASIYLRGRRFINIPSTWLSALDSAHGGKNGLNLSGRKNQIGTFYPAHEIYIVNELLSSQPDKLLTDAMGEAIKISIINDPKSFIFFENSLNRLNSKVLLKILPKLIKDKYKVVELDPYEQNGQRRVLNLGHTLGHVFESHYGWPHGICVLLGILFSVRWSYQLKILGEKDYIRISNLIETVLPEVNLSADLSGVSEKILTEYLLKDKKLTSESEIDFIFIQKVGKVSRAKVFVGEILTEIRRQKSEY